MLELALGQSDQCTKLASSHGKIYSITLRPHKKYNTLSQPCNKCSLDSVNQSFTTPDNDLEDLNIRSSGVTVSYNDNNLLEKQMENDQSKLGTFNANIL